MNVSLLSPISLNDVFFLLSFRTSCTTSNGKQVNLKLSIEAKEEKKYNESTQKKLASNDNNFVILYFGDSNTYQNEKKMLHSRLFIWFHWGVSILLFGQFRPLSRPYCSKSTENKCSQANVYIRFVVNVMDFIKVNVCKWNEGCTKPPLRFVSESSLFEYSRTMKPHEMV